MDIVKFLKGFGYAFKGIWYALATQANMRIHTIAVIAVAAMGFWFDIQWFEWCLVVFACGFVISAEIMNSAIEALADFISPQENPLIGRVKDMAAGVVLIAALTALIIGLLVFVPYLVAMV